MKKVRFCYYCFSSNCIKGLLFSSKGLALRPSNIFFCIPLTLNFKGAGEMTKQNPPLNTDTVLWWLQPTNEMDLASGFETYLTAYCSYQNKKESENEKHKKQKRYELTPRYQRVRPKYGQSALAFPQEAKINKH